MDAVGERNTRFVLPGVSDLFGANPPSGVANSQWHYGQAVPIYIEDQPLFRGSVVAGAAEATLLYSDTKLLVNNFSKNDFGDA